MKENENKYLQKVDLKRLQKEVGMTIRQIAALAGIGYKVVYKWSYLHQDSSRPDYNVIVQLLQRGATVQTLFGVDYDGIHHNIPMSANAQEIFNSPEFQDGLNKAVENAVKKKAIEDLKNRGLIG